jgi:hypothetical protein
VVAPRIEPGPLDQQPGTLTTRQQRRSGSALQQLYIFINFFYETKRANIYWPHIAQCGFFMIPKLKISIKEFNFESLENKMRIMTIVFPQNDFR